MAHSILHSARRGAYLAIAIYLAVVLLLSLGAASWPEAPVQAAYPASAPEHGSAGPLAAPSPHGDVAGA
ncbi:hypothetical protein BK634_17135 [Pseudomonas chlororaphis]|jgi:hypothetical protein|uniref:Energy transducer TonB n=1 Tax=Pseudomonas morbosilactucae TaxID=2938197 RepID=A0ABT0JII9_9PSED|nr:hypothetical protein [Pseudomonas morbosilactucae]MCK9815726.1 hypothetical protein [Pseudomonas morbosilactucae]ROL69466.1 hypothetical protein BK634_17135 [Pseudomonas chlororaphis]WEK07057.1 MAG: hypothetical protein P0Y51_17030 [Pseudomonas sp.]